MVHARGDRDILLAAVAASHPAGLSLRLLGRSEVLGRMVVALDEAFFFKRD